MLGHNISYFMTRYENNKTEFQLDRRSGKKLQHFTDKRFDCNIKGKRNENFLNKKANIRFSPLNSEASNICSSVLATRTLAFHIRCTNVIPTMLMSNMVLLFESGVYSNREKKRIINVPYRKLRFVVFQFDLDVSFFFHNMALGTYTYFVFFFS